MQNPINGTLASYDPHSQQPVVVIDDDPNLGHAGPLHNNLDGDKVVVMALIDNTGPRISKGDTFLASSQDLTGDLVAYRP